MPNLNLTPCANLDAATVATLRAALTCDIGHDVTFTDDEIAEMATNTVNAFVVVQDVFAQQARRRATAEPRSSDETF
jgi:hypothetical protein